MEDELNGRWRMTPMEDGQRVNSLMEFETSASLQKMNKNYK
jgi:hypothetical protein